MPRIGTEFAGYRIEALLGRGGMSVVYRAENARLGNKVALKLLAEELANDESFRERFVRESRTAATLNHPNIVTIYDAGDWDGVLYIAMRYVEATSSSCIAREGPLSPDQDARRSSAQVGSALDAAHARGLLHRDVKPANILLEPGAEPGGVPHRVPRRLRSDEASRVAERDHGVRPVRRDDRLHVAGADRGARRGCDGRTSTRSAASSSNRWRVATPFRRETEVAVLWAHMRDEPPARPRCGRSLPEEVDRVIAKAMAKRPDERYETCADLSPISGPRSRAHRPPSDVSRRLLTKPRLAPDRRLQPYVKAARASSFRWRSFSRCFSAAHSAPSATTGFVSRRRGSWRSRAAPRRSTARFSRSVPTRFSALARRGNG